MLNIYQEFVRNHQYSLQVLANCKQNRDFDKLLKQYESNAACEGRMLETFLTYPMFQVHHTHTHTPAVHPHHMTPKHKNNFTACRRRRCPFVAFVKIPRYIITLHELLAHTPHEHVERKSLEFAKSKLEELSRCVLGSLPACCDAERRGNRGQLLPRQSDARRSERHGEHPEESGHREDDSGGL